jgi:ferritin-like metal-binding protein YciE
MKQLEELFLGELADIYDAENRLAKALPKMVRAATHEELKEVFQKHLDETEDQVNKLERVFSAFGKSAKGKKCETMVGLVKEAEEIASENKGEPTINAALISAAQKIELYEIVSYGCLREWAEQLGKDEAAGILQEILDEEKAADEALTELARQRCNESAQETESDEDERYVGSRPELARQRCNESAQETESDEDERYVGSRRSRAEAIYAK